MNLITQPQKQWQQIPFSKQRPRWRWDDGRITQQVSSTGKKFPTGFALMTHVGEEYNHLKCVFSPGNVYHSGIIFNYQDKENFMLAVVNNLSTSYKGYQLMIGEVLKGDFSSVCLEKYNGRLEADCVLELFEFDEMLQVKLNNKEVFEWDKVGFDRQSKIGLYTQQNKDAQFFELLALEMEIVISEITEDSITDPGSNLAQDELTILPEQEIDPTLNYLNIKPPASNTQIEFNEVFSVPLDSFYNHLNEVIHADKIGADLAIDKSENLDQRPRRWYRELRDIENELNSLKEQLARQKLIAEKPKEILSEELKKTEFDKSRILELEDEHDEMSQKFKKTQGLIDAKNEEKVRLLRDIRTSGFLVESLDSNSEIYSLGYPLSISKPIPKGRGFKPLSVEEDFDFKSDANWKKLEGKLYKTLFETGAIREDGKDIYLENQQALESLEANQEIKDKLTFLGGELDRLDDDIDLEKKAKAFHLEEKEAWKKDKANLIAKKGDFKPYNSNNFVMSPGSTTDMTMWKESLELSNWVNRNDHQSISYEEYMSPVREYNKKAHKERDLDSFREVYHPIHMTHNFGVHKMNRLLLSRSYHYVEKPDVKGIYFIVGLFYPDLDLVTGIDIVCAQRNSGFPRFETVYVRTKNTHPHAQNIHRYLDKCIAVCDHYINHHNIEYSRLDKSKLESERALVQKEYDLTKNTALAIKRKEFLKFWNDPQNTLLQDLRFDLIYPDIDPLSDFLVKLDNESSEKEFVKTYFYTETEDGYYNQFGQSLRDFIGNKILTSQPNVSLFPILDTYGQSSGELIKVVKNPQRSAQKPSLPIIKFVETYQIDIAWGGYGLGELSHTINLFPGESKELVIEKKTKITSKTEESRKEGDEIKQRVTSSFEDNLQNTFSEQDKSDTKTEDKSKRDTSNTGEDSSEDTSESTSELSAEVTASAEWGWGSVDATVNSKNTSKNTSSNSSKRAFSLAQTNEGLKASNQSKDVLKKNINNTVNKVANETSRNNKVEFSAMSTEEFQTDVSNKEVIRVENPNIGRTVNYNFFQIQNQYATSLKLTDVKIVINSGQEIIEGTGIQDMRVYELEEFGKIFANSEGTSHDVITCAIIARQVFKHYAKFSSGITEGNGALHLPEGEFIDPSTIGILNLTSEEVRKFKDDKELLNKLTSALDTLKKAKFTFKEQLIQEATTLSVNTGAYHMEASVGKLPATEAYLEERRDIETDQKRAELAHLKAQTSAGIFFDPFKASNQNQEV